MKSGYDINLIKWDWYLILPISMSRIANSQNPDFCYEVIEYFLNKLESFGNDVVILYTNWLYFNSQDITFELRKKTNQQILDHRNKLFGMIEKNKKFIPKAFHFLPIDYVILNSKYFLDFFNILKKLEQKDELFRSFIQKDMWDRLYNEANVNFIIEEVVVSHIIRQRMVEFPRTLVKNDEWRLIVYPWSYISSDVYQRQNNILPKLDKINVFNASHYDFSQKKLYIYDDIIL